MSKNIQRNTKLLIVSDTKMIKLSGEIFAFGPVVKELNSMLTVFEEITWIGFKHDESENNKSLVKITNKRIRPILIPRVGGKTFVDKIKIILSYPKMFLIILKEVKKHNRIHSRAPSNPAVILMIISLFYRQKKFWHKYAGSWIDKLSFFYRFQRVLLTKLSANSKITINGQYNLTINKIIPFENPCIDQLDREIGKSILEKKVKSDKVIFCFVGALNEHKGVSKIIKALKDLKKIDSESTKTFHFVGDGPLRVDYEEMAMECDVNCVFHGFLQKQEIQKIYTESHFIVLPSKSEGFPKVIGEAMNFGCIPIVSDVSCIGQYIIDNKNGFLLENLKNETILHKLGLAIHLNQENYLKWIQNNFNLAENFTYSHYNNRIINEIFN